MSEIANVCCSLDAFANELQHICCYFGSKGIKVLPQELQESAKEVKKYGDQIHFLYQEETGRLLRILQTQPLTDIWIEEPEMEEIFLHYYQ